MPTSLGTIDTYKVSLGDLLIVSKISIGNDVVYTAGNTVTYYIDSNIMYQEEVDADDTVLSPKTFTPAKDGWEFVGWRQDTTASSSVLTSLTMGDDPLTLYAVFRQAVTVTYYNGNTTKQTSTGYRYYNNGNTVNPSFSIAQTTLSGWTARGWSTATTGNGAISYTAISNTAFSANTTLYGMYQQTITLTLYNGSATASKPTGIRYYNSGSGAVVNPTFTVAATTISGWTFRGWSTSNAGNGAISYNAISNTAFAANTTLYALYQLTITLSYNGNGNTGGSTASQTGTRYYSSAGTYVNPSFTIRANGFAKTTYSFVQWRLNGTSGTAYAPNATLTLTANATLYAEWKYVGNPITIQNNYTSYANITWTVNRANNITKKIGDTFTWTANGSTGSMSSGLSNTSSGGGLGVISSSIATGGNRTLAITIYGRYGPPAEVTVNNQYKTFPTEQEGGGTVTQTFDVSNVSNFTINVYAGKYAYQGNPSIDFTSIKLS